MHDSACVTLQRQAYVLSHHTFSLTFDYASQYHIGCMQVYEGQWQGQTVAIKVLDGAAAASQKAMKEVSFRKTPL